MKPWRQIAKPHRDVLEGTLKQSEFAADIFHVLQGDASPEYMDAEKFYARTYITEGMRLLLISVAQRLTGKAGDPVIQLQTNFGGGKTHTLLAVYHLATHKVSTDRLAGIPSLLDEAGVTTLPQAKVAVIDGNNLSPNQPVVRGALTINTIWGQLAYQLLGVEGYDMVADSDKTGTAPGKEVVVELLKKAAPCVILLDELVAFFRQLDDSKDLTAGKFGSNVSFIQILTESVKAVPNAILLASLPESDTEAAGTFGRTALTTLEKYFGRVESVWKPVASDEAFEIVRRRLFDTIGDAAEMEATCREFVDFYRKNKDKLPQEVQESSYFERMKKSYPIHPEVFDRLYEDWSTLDKFQKTRGVLQYMAIIIHRLWNANDQDPLILPASIPLEDTNVRIKSTHYLPQGWDPIIEKEVDGPSSAPARIDGSDTRFGSIFAATRAARTIFLGSAPSTSSQGTRGISVERILLGCAVPGQTLSTYEDVLKRLRDKLHYLFSDVDRFWFDTRPNLRREMETRKGKVDGNLVTKTTKEIVAQLCGHGHILSGVHVFTPHADIPDDIGGGPRMVVMSADSLKAYAKANTKPSFDAAREILEHRGEQPRIHRNRLVFLAPDMNIVSRALDQCRIFLAWSEIVADIENGRLNLDTFQVKQAKKEKEIAQQILRQELLECYRYVLVPRQSTPREVTFDVSKIGTSGGGSIATTVEKQLTEDQNLILQWSPVHLKNLLQKTYFNNGQIETSLQKVWEDCCNYYQMPRLLNKDVFLRAVCDGVSKGDFFGFALGKEGDTYLGFEYATEMVQIGVDSNALLIVRETAEAYKVAHAPKTEPTSPSELGNQQHGQPGFGASTETREQSGIGNNATLSQPGPQTPQHRHYFGTIELDSLKGTMQFANIMSEIISHFTAKTGVKVILKLDIEAHSDKAFDVTLERTVKENGTVLGIRGDGFTEE
ncbi:MAG: ATP-binding protein [Victivallales bacterium]|nr:ATP-binding protein [Victivallales bacterium]